MIDIIHNMNKNTQDQSNIDTDTKSSFEEPKLSFIEPKLTKQGDATKITQQGSPGFFGTMAGGGGGA